MSTDHETQAFVPKMELNNVSVDAVENFFSSYIVKISSTKMLQGILYMLAGIVLVPLNYGLVKLFLILPDFVIHLAFGGRILTNLKYFLFFMMFVNIIEFIRKIVSNYPINAFYSYSIAETFKNTSSDLNSSSATALTHFIVMFYRLIFCYSGRLLADGLYIFIQSWLLFGSKNKYKKIITVLTQSETPIEFDVIRIFADSPKEDVIKKIDLLVDASWVIQTTKGYKLSTVHREIFNPDYQRESSEDIFSTVREAVAIDEINRLHRHVAEVTKIEPLAFKIKNKEEKDILDEQELDIITATE